MKNKYLFGLFALLILASCQDYYAEPVVDNIQVQSTSSMYNIPIDSALAYLNTFIKDENMSRDDGKRVVANIFPIKYNMVVSRADEDSIDCENLLYVANFEGDAGYAILAADKRISDKVIAIIDQGYMSYPIINNYVTKVTVSDRLTLGWYPEQGDGFFTVPEAGNELFINPNTVDLYVREEQDTLVGNFEIETLEGLNGNGNVIGGQEKFSNVEYLSTSLCVSYAVNEIRRAKVLGGFTTIDGDAIGGDEEIGGDDHIVPTTRTEMIVSGWEIIKSTPMLLSSYKSWHQRWPFNDLYPKRRKYLFFGQRSNAPAGCFPLAISKVMTRLETPTDFAYDDGWIISWSELNKWSDEKNGFESATGELSASYLLSMISRGCSSWYFYAGTFTFPNNATSFMRKTGFPNAHSHYYSFERVTGMIDNGKPLIIYAMPNLNVFGSHAWNIDGYKIKERSIITCTYYGDQLVNVDTRIEKYDMVHCDFGWRGKNNGYYVSGIFKLNDYRVEHDNPNDIIDSTKYDTWLRVITY